MEYSSFHLLGEGVVNTRSLEQFFFNCMKYEAYVSIQLFYVQIIENTALALSSAVKL